MELRLLLSVSVIGMGMLCLNIAVSVGGCDLLLGLSLTSGNSGSDGDDSCHSVLAFLYLGDCDVAGVDGDLVGSSVGLGFGDFVDMDGPFLSMDLDDLSLVSLAGSSKDDDLIILADGEGADAVFVSEGLGQGGGHDSVSQVGGG